MPFDAETYIGKIDGFRHNLLHDINSPRNWDAQGHLIDLPKDIRHIFTGLRQVTAGMAAHVDKAFSGILSSLDYSPLPLKPIPLNSDVDEYKNTVCALRTVLISHLDVNILVLKAIAPRNPLTIESMMRGRPSQDILLKDYPLKLTINDINYEVDKFISWLRYVAKYIQANEEEIDFDEINDQGLKRRFSFYENRHNQLFSEKR